MGVCLSGLSDVSGINSIVTPSFFLYPFLLPRLFSCINSLSSSNSSLPCHPYSEEGQGWKLGSKNSWSSSRQCATSSSSERVLTPGMSKMDCMQMKAMGEFEGEWMKQGTPQAG